MVFLCCSFCLQHCFISKMAPAPMATPDNKLSFAVKNIVTSIYKILPVARDIQCFALNKVMRRRVADLTMHPNQIWSYWQYQTIKKGRPKAAQVTGLSKNATRTVGETGQEGELKNLSHRVARHSMRTGIGDYTNPHRITGRTLLEIVNAVKQRSSIS